MFLRSHRTPDYLHPLPHPTPPPSPPHLNSFMVYMKFDLDHFLCEPYHFIISVCSGENYLPSDRSEVTERSVRETPYPPKCPIHDRAMESSLGSPRTNIGSVCFRMCEKIYKCLHRDSLRMKEYFLDTTQHYILVRSFIQSHSNLKVLYKKLFVCFLKYKCIYTSKGVNLILR